MAWQFGDVSAILGARAGADARLAAMIEDQRHVRHTLRKVADDGHLGDIDVDLEIHAELFEEVYAGDQIGAQSQRARIGIEFNDAADAPYRRVVFRQFRQDRLDPRAPFERRHRHDRLEAWIALYPRRRLPLPDTGRPRR